MKISKLLKHLADIQELSQSDISSRTGMSRQKVGRILRGENGNIKDVNLISSILLNIDGEQAANILNSVNEIISYNNFKNQIL